MEYDLHDADDRFGFDYPSDWDSRLAPGDEITAWVDGEPISIYERDADGGFHPISGPAFEAEESYDSPADRLAVEVLDLPARLMDRLRLHERDVTSRRAHTLADSFLGDSPLGTTQTGDDSPPEEAEGDALPTLPPQPPSRVRAEVAAVEHMLHTAIVWMSTVAPSSLSPEVQEGLAAYAERAFVTALRFPRAREVLEAAPSSPPSAFASGGVLPSELIASTVDGDAGSNEGPSTSQRRRRPNRRPRRA
jgi:hypothetical protein